MDSRFWKWTKIGIGSILATVFLIVMAGYIIPNLILDFALIAVVAIVMSVLVLPVCLVFWYLDSRKKNAPDQSKS